MTRWKAAAIHLLISFVVLASVAGVLLWRWYPPALLEVAKADKLMLILAGVDVMLGPVLTLIVYKHGKKSLRFDLTVIALLQLAAFGYGLHTVWQSRPVYLVAVVDRFQMVFANEIDAADLARAPLAFESLPWTGIETIGAKLPERGEDRNRVLFAAMSGKDIHLLPEHYVPYGQVARDIAPKALPVSAAEQSLAPGQAEDLRRIVTASRFNPAQVGVVPVASIRSSGSAAMLVDLQTGDLLRPVAIDLWSAQPPRSTPSYPQPD